MILQIFMGFRPRFFGNKNVLNSYGLRSKFFKNINAPNCDGLLAHVIF